MLRVLSVSFTAVLLAGISACSSTPAHDCPADFGKSAWWVPESTVTSYSADGEVDIAYADGTITRVDSRTSAFAQTTVEEDHGSLYVFIYALYQDTKHQEPGYLAAKILVSPAPPGQSTAITTAYSCPYADDSLGYGNGQPSDTDLSCLGADGSSHPAQAVALSGTLVSKAPDSSEAFDADVTATGTIVMSLHLIGRSNKTGGYCQSSG